MLGRLRAARPVCAIDTEADSLHSYREKLCLIQFSCDEEIKLIDPLMVEDLSPLMEFLDRAEVWMHGADFDMSILRRTFGSIPPVVYDTQLAARLVGYRRFGLAHLVENLFDVKLSKQSQRANWGKRPFSEKLLTYALNDVRYILPLREHLVSRLRELGRYDWFLQSCDSAREAVLVRPEKSDDTIWRIPGAGKLTRRGMAYLREFWHWRDNEAMKQDRPAFKVFSNDAMIKASSEFDAGREFELPERFRNDLRERFMKAVKRAAALEEKDWPVKMTGQRSEKDPGFRRAFDALRARRDETATALEIDETLVASKATLERLVAEPSSAEEVLLPWQRALLGIE